MNVNKILVVEDDQDIRFLLVETLADIGYEMIEAADGGAGLRRAFDDRPAIILLDVMMPVMDGFQVLERLKDNPDTHSIPIIMISAKGTEQEIMRAMRGGAWGYLIKPWSPDDLESKVRNVEAELQLESGRGCLPMEPVGNLLELAAPD